MVGSEEKGLGAAGDGGEEGMGVGAWQVDCGEVSEAEVVAAELQERELVAPPA